MLIGIGKTQYAWVKEQSVKGTPVWPAAADAVLLAGEGKLDQGPSFFEDPQYRDSLDKSPRLKGLYPPGTLSIPAMIKASGALGTAPVPGAMLKSLLGKETVVGSTSVTYSQYGRDDSPVYLSILAKDNFETLLAQDVVITKGALKVLAADSVDAFISMVFSGMFLKALRAGTDTTSALAPLGATTIPVTDARRFDVGQKIIVGTSGVTSGHEVTARDLSANELTIAAAGLESEQPSGVTVRGWTPAVTEAGYLMHGRFGKYQEKIGAGAYADVFITEADLEISNGLEALNDVKSDDGYPYDFTRSGGATREVKFTLGRYFEAAGTALFYEADAQTVKLLKLQAAAAAYSSSSGKRMEIAMNNVQFDPPSVSGDKLRKQGVNGFAYPTTVGGNDAITIAFA